MVEKEEKTITLLLCLHILTLLLVCCTDSEIDLVNKSIDDIREVQTEQNNEYWHLSENVNESLSEVYVRLDDIERVNRAQTYRLAVHRQEIEDNAQMFSDLLYSTEHLEEYMRSLPDNAWGIEITEQEEYLVSSLVYLEAGGQGCSYELKKAIATVFFNQMLRYGLTVNQTIYRSGAFSVASRVRSTVPSSSCRMAVRDVLENGGTLPKNVIAFQLGNYHSFGVPYTKIQNVYFNAV